MALALSFTRQKLWLISHSQPDTMTANTLDSRIEKTQSIQIANAKAGLCYRCKSWDFKRLFQSDVEYTHISSKNSQYTRTWNRRLLQEVESNINCRLCCFVISVLRNSARWNTVQARTSSTFYIEFTQFWLGYLHKELDGHSYTQHMTMLALEIIDHWDPAKCSLHLAALSFPSIQAFRFESNADDHHVDNLMTGRHIGEEVNFDLIQGWIQSCDSHHLECVSMISKTDVSIILIDVQGRRIVHATTSANYVALSYVWGPSTTQQARLTNETLATFCIEGTLADDEDWIPRTIRDALVVCERLNVPYLWVDAICLVQDGIEFHKNLGLMNIIYGSASFTIVAASGTDSNAGLPGVRNKTRSIDQPCISVKGMEIGLALPDFWETVIKSPWSERGWTFQERLFSERLLVFTEVQSFFLCGTTSRIESIKTETDDSVTNSCHSFSTFSDWKDRRNALRTSIGGEIAENALLEYFELIWDYRWRTFTYPADILKAFGGVIAAFKTQLAAKFHYGLPIKFFGQALMLDYLQCARQIHFPSWSWVGWTADRMLKTRDTLAWRLKWWVIRSARMEIIFYRFSLNPPLPKSQHHHILERIDGLPMLDTENQQENDQLLLKRCQSPTIQSGHNPENLLVFWTFTSTLEVSVYDEPSIGHGKGFDKQNNMVFGRLSGTSLGDKIYINAPAPPYLSREWFDVEGEQPTDNILLESVLIARGAPHAHYGESACLMLIDTDKDGISSKISLCIVDAEAWFRTQPQLRMIILE